MGAPPPNPAPATKSALLVPFPAPATKRFLFKGSSRIPRRVDRGHASSWIQKLPQTLKPPSIPPKTNPFRFLEPSLKRHLNPKNWMPPVSPP